MPFQSEAQRRFMWMKHPDIARRWAHEYPGQGPKNLPMHAARTGALRRRMESRHGKAHSEGA